MTDETLSTIEQTGLDAATEHLEAVRILMSEAQEVQIRSLPFIKLALEAEKTSSFLIKGFSRVLEEDKDNSDMVNRALIIITDPIEEEEMQKRTVFRVSIDNGTYTVAAFPLVVDETITASNMRSPNWVSVTEPKEEKRIFLNAIYHLADKVSLVKEYTPERIAHLLGLNGIIGDNE